MSQYSTDHDPYVDPHTGVLFNRLGISNQEKLDQAEGIITTPAIIAATLLPVMSSFDLAHLQAIHKQLFESIYEWAGEIRTTELAKENTHFANSEFLQQSSRVLFDELESENLLVGLDTRTFCRRLAHYYCEVNILHPFREGNGRTQRVFFTLLAQHNGRTIAWDRMNAKENIRASELAYHGDESLLVSLLSQLIIT